MALALLDGTYAAVDFSVDADGAGGTAAVSLKCFFRVIVLDEAQALIQYATFCSSRWMASRPGMRGLTGSLLGYVSSGTTYSAPGSLTSLGSPNPTILVTYDTGCTRSFQAVFTRDSNSIEAFGSSSRIVEFVSDGAVTTTWVVA